MAGVTDSVFRRLCKEHGADVVVTGHQPQETGHLRNGDRHLILASDHNQGVFLPLKLDRKYDADVLES